ncbi:MAG: hypothetical protein DWH82_13025 [Planctomycetota bacterium]|nr:MAG: hypothetical protein DWH82_13025 [Planctomycetota bacterium]
MATRAVGKSGPKGLNSVKIVQLATCKTPRLPQTVQRADCAVGAGILFTDRPPGWRRRVLLVVGRRGAGGWNIGSRRHAYEKTPVLPGVLALLVQLNLNLKVPRVGFEPTTR